MIIDINVFVIILIIVSIRISCINGDVVSPLLSSSAVLQSFSTRHELIQFAHDHHLQIHVVHVNRALLLQSEELHKKNPHMLNSSNSSSSSSSSDDSLHASHVFLPLSLTFGPTSTHLPFRFHLEKIYTSESNGFIYTEASLAQHTKAIDNSDTATSSYTVEGLELGAKHINDDFKVVMKSVLRENAHPYTTVRAVGFVMAHNTIHVGEKLSALGIDGRHIGSVGFHGNGNGNGNVDDKLHKFSSDHNEDIDVGIGRTFFGVGCESLPLGEITYIEDSSGKDAVVLESLIFVAGPSALMDGWSLSSRSMFWLIFHLAVAMMLAVDLFASSGNSAINSCSNSTVLWAVNSVRERNSLMWTIVWTMIGVAFASAVWIWRGLAPAMDWLTCWVLEKSLSIDNLFVFVSVFRSFRTPLQMQRKVLTIGIVTAAILRALFIFGGTLLVSYFNWLLGIFGFFLILMGIRLMRESISNNGESISDGSGESPNRALALVEAFLPVTAHYDHMGKFFIRDVNISQSVQPSPCNENNSSFSVIIDGVNGTPTVPTAINTTKADNDSQGVRELEYNEPWSRQFFRYLGFGRWRATPLLVVLVVIEMTDLIFALDSLPAVIAITADPFIAYTSNILAILGLRALYFVLAAGINMFEYLPVGLALILVFIGSKMLLSFPPFLVHVSPTSSLLFVAVTLFFSIVLSLHRRQFRCLTSKQYQDSGLSGV